MSGKGDHFDRRAVMARIGLLAVLPSLLSTAPAHAEGNPAFRPPTGPMLFTRRLLRELPGGAAIIVTRSFRIQFLPLADGYLVEGSQASAQVSAPATLAAFARLEEQRQETGMFPLRLDASGRIVAGPGEAGRTDFTAVVEETFSWLARQPLARAERMQAQEFVMGLNSVAARITTSMPLDLFTGSTSPVERTQRLTMPDGNPGRISVSYGANPQAGGGILVSAERIVTTDAGGSALRSIEHWTLEPLKTTASR
jgi:hypothetical protein